jgi:hypothetical protein
MKNPTDQQLAKHYLAHRDGYSLGYVFRQSKLNFIFLGSLLLILGFGFGATDDYVIKGFCLWGIGMFLGAIVRDLGWLQKTRKQWSFTERIIDWQKVEKIAASNKPE